MDPVHYEKIADKLMQFRGKIPKDDMIHTESAENYCQMMRKKIDDLLLYIDAMAKFDDAGHIR